MGYKSTDGTLHVCTYTHSRSVFVCCCLNVSWMNNVVFHTCRDFARIFGMFLFDFSVDCLIYLEWEHYLVLRLAKYLEHFNCFQRLLVPVYYWTPSERVTISLQVAVVGVCIMPCMTIILVCVQGRLLLFASGPENLHQVLVYAYSNVLCVCLCVCV